MTLGTRIVVMKDGLVQQVDSPKNLYESQITYSLQVSSALHQMNFLDAVVVEDGESIKLQVGKKELRLPAQRGELLRQKGYVGKTIVLGIRPENVYDSKLYQLDDYDNTIEAEIKVYELLGAEIFLYFDVEGKQMIARVNPNTALTKGDTAKFALDMNKAHLFDKETEQVIR